MEPLTREVGYEYVRRSLDLTALPPARIARVKPVTRLTELADGLAVPRTIAPTGEDAPTPAGMLDHILFALKHEGTNLAVLAEALPKIPGDTLLEALHESPNGLYLRKAAFLWEAFTKETLPVESNAGGATVPLFDPERYVTGPSQRNARWRVDFNGLGSLDYCPTVERTPEIEALLNSDILGRAKRFMDELPAELTERAISWAYLHETQSSFAIERETPSEDRAERFVDVLRQAHQRRILTEEYLVELQNTCVSNPFDQAAIFRTEQNHLANGSRGAAGVTYVPPPPEMVEDLMNRWMDMANSLPSQTDPLVAAAVASFGFVYIHPFMDGNGRLSRFLIHHALCSSGQLENGLLLPVSVAMKHHEADYLASLTTFSKPARDRWRVKWIDDDQYAFEFRGHGAMYRYWDATPAVKFVQTMAQQALEVELRRETDYLQNYDQVKRIIEAKFDVRNTILSRLIVMCLDNDGVVSKNRRKQFAGQVPDALFPALEAAVRETLGAPDSDEEGGADDSHVDGRGG
ncbi:MULTISPECIES: Fic family protein [unclassified Burkholderia]|uniref:Fic family protein n=1 Tax=unclassified Burkholderia TaxID=2613784 RepID=UPI002AAF3C7D|nr:MULTISPECIES: Fic family protein [unclassified Burkholderia]